MKRIIPSLIWLCFYFIFPTSSFADDAPTFPPTLPFTYNGATYYNVIAQTGSTAACGGFSNIKELIYYNKASTFAISAYVSSAYGTPATGVTAVTITGTSRAVRFFSRTQNSTVNYAFTEYANGGGFTVSNQCYCYKMDSNSIYTNNDISRLDDSTIFKASNVVSPRLLSVNIYPLEGGSVAGDGIACDFLHLGACQNYFGQNGDAAITATANPGYVLSYVQDGAIQSVDNPYTTTMDKDRSVTVVFKSVWDWLLNPSTMPYFPPRVPFIYNGITYYNVIAQIGNSSACGGFKNIRQLVYYNKSASNTPLKTFNSAYNVVNGAATYGISNAIRFYSATQDATVSYGITEYTNPSGISIGAGQCATVAMNPNSVYSNNDVMKPDNTVFKAANVASPVKLSIIVNPLEGGSVTGNGIACNVCTSGICQYYVVKNSNMTLHAEPKSSDYVFVHWKVNGEIQSTNADYAVMMDNSKNVEAVFKRPLFGFPLAGYTPYTAPVTSVFDHSGSAQYDDTDHKVVAFNGESSGFQTPYSGTTCYRKIDSSIFGIGFKYNGYSLAGAHYLCYNGHPGYDYAVDGANVYSVATGTVRFAGYDACLGNMVTIEHAEGYITKYCHLGSINTVNVQADQPIQSGILIGQSGNTGTCSDGPHLHFQTENSASVPIDPYGWTGNDVDPYTKASSINLWE
jgi:murein DD-endopeptidase MepM/ murein hydrolase activator NlpD